MAAALAAATGLLAATAGTGGARVADGTAGKVSGMAISPSGIPQLANGVDLKRIRSNGINTVSMTVHLQVDPARQVTVTPGPTTPTDVELTTAIDQARKAGLRVVLDPLLDCSTCEGHWRGGLKPADVNAFFASYTAALKHYAAIAQQTGVWIFFIGSEMDSVQLNAGAWRAVSRGVKDVFKGPIAYGVNWGSARMVPFWDSVDVAGISAYFPLTDAAHPSVSTLMAGWHGNRTAKWGVRHPYDDVVFVAFVSRRPVLFSEVGYRSIAHAGQDPATASTSDTVDQQAAANAYQALLQTFEKEPWWLGALWWQWEVSSGSHVDTGYSPKGKLGESFLQRWYGGWRPGDTSTGAPAKSNLPVIG